LKRRGLAEGEVLLHEGRWWKNRRCKEETRTHEEDGAERMEPLEKIEVLEALVVITLFHSS
jgi:hypothetical protein